MSALVPNGQDYCLYLIVVLAATKCYRNLQIFQVQWSTAERKGKEGKRKGKGKGRRGEERKVLLGKMMGTRLVNIREKELTMNGH